MIFSNALAHAFAIDFGLAKAPERESGGAQSSMEIGALNLE